MIRQLNLSLNDWISSQYNNTCFFSLFNNLSFIEHTAIQSSPFQSYTALTDKYFFFRGTLFMALATYLWWHSWSPSNMWSQQNVHPTKRLLFLDKYDQVFQTCINKNYWYNCSTLYVSLINLTCVLVYEDIFFGFNILSLFLILMLYTNYNWMLSIFSLVEVISY